MHTIGAFLTTFALLALVEGFHLDIFAAVPFILAMAGLLTYYVRAEMRVPINQLSVMKQAAEDAKQAQRTALEALQKSLDAHRDSQTRALEAHHNALRELIEEFKKYRHETISPFLMETNEEVQRNKILIDGLTDKQREISLRLDRYEQRLERYEQNAFRHHGDR